MKTITLTPEHEELLNEVMRCGAYNDPGQAIGHALEVLRLEDQSLRKQRRSVDEKISRGLAQLREGLGIPADEILTRLQLRKSKFLAENPQVAE